MSGDKMDSLQHEIDVLEARNDKVQRFPSLVRGTYYPWPRVRSDVPHLTAIFIWPTE